MSAPSCRARRGLHGAICGDTAEFPGRSWASWRRFYPDEPEEKYEGWTWYYSIQRQPLYRRDLDIVVVPEHPWVLADRRDRRVVTAWYDDVTRTAYFEPVGTAPEYQRRGLGKAVMAAALRRLQRMGCLVAFVGGYSAPANALYASGGSPSMTSPSRGLSVGRQARIRWTTPTFSSFSLRGRCASARIVIESLRAFGGLLADCPVWGFLPDRNPYPIPWLA